jgi:cellulose synthase (UDP-forming)
LNQVLAFTIPHVFGAVMLSDFLYGHVRHPFFSELYESVQSFFNLPSIISTLARPRSPSFKVTPKIQDLARDRLSPLAAPFYILFILALLAYPGAVHRWFSHPAEVDTIIICLFWSTFNLMLVFLCLGVVWEKHQYRSKHRVSTNEPATVKFPDGKQASISVTVEDISEDGVGLAVADSRIFPLGQKLELQVTDSYGMNYRLPCEVIRADTSDRSHYHVGCRFVVRDVRTKAAVIGYVFGDSTRWERFWMERRKYRIGVPRGTFRLFSLGLKGTTRHISGLVHIMKRATIKQWKRA